MRLALFRLASAAVIVLALASCGQPAEPVIVAPPPPEPAASPAPQPTPSTWSFQAGESCAATIGGTSLSLDLTASNGALEFVARTTRSMTMQAGSWVPIAFAGSRGTWTVTGREISRRRVIASQPMTEDKAGQILILLEGGILRLGTRQDALPALRVPSGGATGRDWFECVRRQLFP
jgi:hypothetical protein